MSDPSSFPPGPSAGTPAGASSPASPWRLPQPSLRWLPIWRRNLLVWRKLAGASILGNVVDPLITLVAFGYGLGALLPQVEGVRYIVFLAAGSVCMSTMLAASFESLYSAFSRMHVQKTWESLLNTPVDLDDVLIAEWLWAATKSLFSAVAIVAVIFALDIARHPMLLWLLPLAALTGLAFAAIGLCFNALARGYDFFAYYFTLVITPMIFLSGAYYPVSQLPPWLSPVAQALPLTAAVDLARPLVLGGWPPNAAADVAQLVATTAVAFMVALALTRRRFAS